MECRRRGTYWPAGAAAYSRQARGTPPPLPFIRQSQPRAPSSARPAPSIEHVQIRHRRAHAPMGRTVLESPPVVAGLELVRRTRVPPHRGAVNQIQQPRSTSTASSRDRASLPQRGSRPPSPRADRTDARSRDRTEQAQVTSHQRREAVIAPTGQRVRTFVLSEP